MVFTVGLIRVSREIVRKSYKYWCTGTEKGGERLFNAVTERKMPGSDGFRALTINASHTLVP